MVNGTAAGSSIPKQVERFAWLSKSTARTFFPISARQYARFQELAVLPTPPLNDPHIIILPIMYTASFDSDFLIVLSFRISLRLPQPSGSLRQTPAAHLQPWKSL